MHACSMVDTHWLVGPGGSVTVWTNLLVSVGVRVSVLFLIGISVESVSTVGLSAGGAPGGEPTSRTVTSK